MTIYYW